MIRPNMMTGMAVAIALSAVSVPASAGPDNIVSAIVNSPLSAAGTVKGARTGINIYLQKADAQGLAFMDPKVIGYGVPAGGRLEIEMGEGYERDWDVGLSQAAIMLVTGAPQQGLPGKAVGYTVGEGSEPNIFAIVPTGEKAVVAETLMTPAPGAKGDPIRQRGLKVIHVGFRQNAFINGGGRGTVKVRIIDQQNNIVAQGSTSVDFISESVPQILPTNLTDKRRNHNWQRVKSGDVLGHTDGTVPVALMLYQKAKGVQPEKLHEFKAGIEGAGVMSTQQLRAMKYEKPKALARYNGGLIIRDSNGDGRLDPAADQIIGGVIGKAPKGAKGQELRSLEIDGKPQLSQPVTAIAPKVGKRFGGAIMQLQFNAGSKSGFYRPTLALLRDPANQNSGDGSQYTYTIVVE